MSIDEDRRPNIKYRQVFSSPSVRFDVSPGRSTPASPPAPPDQSKLDLSQIFMPSILGLPLVPLRWIRRLWNFMMSPLIPFPPFFSDFRENLISPFPARSGPFAGDRRVLCPALKFLVASFDVDAILPRRSSLSFSLVDWNPRRIYFSPRSVRARF